MEWFLKRRRYNKVKDIPFDVRINASDNPELMAVMYAAGAAASPNYMTLKECQAVTPSSTVYNNLIYADWSNVTHFDEFQYFTSLDGFDKGSNSSHTQFGYPSLTSVVLPSSLRSVGHLAYNSSLDIFNTRNLEVVGQWDYYHNYIDKGPLTLCNVTDFYLTPSVQAIQRFSNCHITNLHIEDIYAYLNCFVDKDESNNTQALPSICDNIYVGNTLIDGAFFIKPSSAIDDYDFVLGKNLFRGYSKLTSLTVNHYGGYHYCKVTFGEHCFENSGLTTLTIHNNVTLERSKTDCFKNTNISTVYYKDSSTGGGVAWARIIFDNPEANPLHNGGVLHRGWNPWDANLNGPIKANAFYGSGHTSFYFFAVSNIERNAFRENKKLTSISFINRLDASPQSYELTGNIGGSAFEGCTLLTTVQPICNAIGNYAFFNCTSLSSPIPNNGTVTSIGDGAFMGCTSLTTVDLTAVTSIYVWAFRSSHIQTLIANDLVGVGSKGTHVGIFRDAIIDKADLRQGAWSSLGIPTISKLKLSGTITCYDSQAIKNVSLLVLENDLNFIVSTGSVDINVSTPIVICKCSYTVFDLLKLYTGGASWAYNFSTSTCVVADGVDKTNFTTYGFASVQTVTEYNTEHSTTHADIDALATALWNA